MDPNLRQCRLCPAGCVSCLNSDTCLKCKNSYNFLVENKTQKISTRCVENCPLGFYSNINYRADNSSLQCIKCDDRCLDCVGTAFNCSKCGPYMLEQNE